jgi:hypothetical protein
MTQSYRFVALIAVAYDVEADSAKNARALVEQSFLDTEMVRPVGRADDEQGQPLPLGDDEMILEAEMTLEEVTQTEGPDDDA